MRTIKEIRGEALSLLWGLGIILLLLAVLFISLMTIFNSCAIYTGRLYRVDNVYEEIYNMVISERNGSQTILTTSIEGSEIGYDFGCFEQVNIPVNDEYCVVLSFVNQDELSILIFENNNFENDSIGSKSSQYVYDYQSNTLYGNREEAHLIEAFISPYYSWIGNDGKFDPENNGNYTYVYTEFPIFHDGY